MIASRRRSLPLRRGFILVVVLTLITLAALSTAGLARRSLGLALEATRAEQALQERWSRISLQRTLLANAGQLLEDIESKPRRWTGTVQLAGGAFRLILADESAKVPLHVLIDMTQSESVAQLWNELDVEATLRLADGRLSLAGNKPSLQAWGELFDLNGASTEELAQSTAGVTLWGDGRVNVRTADPQVLERVVTLSTGKAVADRLMNELADPKFQDVDQLLDRLALRLEDRQRLHRILDVRSTSHSLWIIPPQGSAHFEVRTQVAQDRIRSDRFTF